MSTLKDYCEYLGWNILELSRQAGINRHTAAKALTGREISTKVARNIAEALSRTLGRTIHVGDIDGLNVKG